MRTRATRSRRCGCRRNTAFHCQYALQFIAVLRGYGLAVDAPSAIALREAAETCPKG